MLLRRCRELIAQGLKEFVPFPEDTSDPAQVVCSIRKFLDGARAAGHSDERLMQISMSVGALWGEQVCRDMGWEWVRLSYESGFEGYAVAAPNRSVVCFPVQYVRRILSQPETDNTTALLFNMLREGKWPTREASAYRIVC